MSTDFIDFGEVVVGAEVFQSFIIANTGTAALQITDIQSDNAAFSVYPPSAFTIAPGDPARSVMISFAPTSEGEFNGVITILNNSGVPQAVTVSGRGVTVATLQVASPLFFALDKNTVERQSVDVSNPGTVARTATIEVLNPHSDLSIILASEHQISVAAGDLEQLLLDIDTRTAEDGTYADIPVDDILTAWKKAYGTVPMSRRERKVFPH